MKKGIVIIVLMCCVNLSIHAQTKKKKIVAVKYIPSSSKAKRVIKKIVCIAEVTPAPTPKESSAIYRFPEVEASFPGGLDSLSSFLGSTLIYPEQERLRYNQGTSHIQFIVCEDGKVCDFNVQQSAGKSFDAEAIRVLKIMPKWKPALLNGKPIKTYYSIPVTFSLSE